MQQFLILQPSLRALDPHTCTDANAVRNWRYALYEALIEHEGHAFAPVLAESWHCGEDARTWTFRLREGVRFHDGRTLSSRDVLYSLERAAGPLIRGELFTVTFHSYLGGMEVEAPDERTIRLCTPEPMADLLELLCDMVIIPEGALADGVLEAGQPGAGRKLPPGTGPYRLDSFSGGSARLRAWEGHWAGARQVRQVEFREQAAESERIECLLRGQAQLITQLSPDGFREIPGDREAELWPIESNLCVIYLMNLESESLQDPRMRRALNLAADKAGMIRDILLGQGEVLNGPLSPLHFGCDTGLPPYAHDPQQARRLVREAGWNGGQIVIHSPHSLPDEAPRLSQRLAGQFGEVGVDARIEMHEDRFEYARKIAEKELEGLYCFDSSPLSTFRVLREKLDSRFRGPWWQGFHSERANELLGRAAASADAAARQALYRQAYRIYREEAPWLYLYRPHRLFAIHSSARGLVGAGPEAVLRLR